MKGGGAGRFDGRPLVQHTGCLLFIDLIELCGWGDADGAARGPYTSWGPTLRRKSLAAYLTPTLPHFTQSHPLTSALMHADTACVQAADSHWFWSSSWIITYYRLHMTQWYCAMCLYVVQLHAVIWTINQYNTILWYKINIIWDLVMAISQCIFSYILFRALRRLYSLVIFFHYLRENYCTWYFHYIHITN